MPISLGSDTNGSIRVPAGLCGIFGVKPTYGRLSRQGVFPFVPSLDHAGPFARTVADLAACYDAMQGYDAEDPYAAQAPVYDYTMNLSDPFPVRLALIRSFYTNECGPEASANLDATVALLQKAGIDVTEVDLGFTAMDVSRDAQPVLASEAA